MSVTDQPGFTYWECQDCGFDAVTRDGSLIKHTPICPLCAGDNGRDVEMTGRVARTTDTDVEGRDARQKVLTESVAVNIVKKSTP